MEYGTLKKKNPTVHVYYVKYCNFHNESHQEFVELFFLIWLFIMTEHQNQKVNQF